MARTDSVFDNGVVSDTNPNKTTGSVVPCPSSRSSISDIDAITLPFHHVDSMDLRGPRCLRAKRAAHDIIEAVKIHAKRQITSSTSTANSSTSTITASTVPRGYVDTFGLRSQNSSHSTAQLHHHRWSKKMKQLIKKVKDGYRKCKVWTPEQDRFARAEAEAIAGEGKEEDWAYEDRDGWEV